MASDKKDTQEKPIALKGVRRALRVLEHIAMHPGKATEIADALKLPWSTLHRTLQQLEAGGFLQRDRPSNQFSIGPRMYFIGSTYIANHRVVEIAKPFLDKSLALSNTTVQLVERSGHESVVLYSAHSDKEIAKATYGFNFPLHAGSKGQVLLAYAEADFIKSYLKRDLEKLTDATVTEPQMIEDNLKKIRRQGYATTVADIQMFAGSMAAPVFDRNQDVVAAICFVGRKSVFENDEKGQFLLEQLMSDAHEISQALGWRQQAKIGSC